MNRAWFMAAGLILAACSPAAAPPGARALARCQIMEDRRPSANANESVDQSTDLRDRSTFLQGCVAEQGR